MLVNITLKNPSFLKTNCFLTLLILLFLLFSCNIIPPGDNVITVTFNSNGGSSISPQTNTSGTTITPPPSPSKATFVFAGWYADEALTASFDFTRYIIKPTTLHARWKVQPTSRAELLNLINPAITANPTTNLNYIDTSLITNMSVLFQNKISFNGNISEWDTSQVIDMSSMFYNAQTFNQPIGNWNTPNVTTMRDMFFDAHSFNQPIDSWDTSKTIYMDGMFLNATNFNQPIGNWVTSQVINMNSMFANASEFNQDIGGWKVSKVDHMYRMFYNAAVFDQDLENWGSYLSGREINKESMFTKTPIDNKKPSWCSTGLKPC